MSNQVKSKSKLKSNETNLKEIFLLHMQKEKALEIYEEISSQLNHSLEKTKSASGLFMYKGNLYRVTKEQFNLRYRVLKIADSGETIQSV